MDAAPNNGTALATVAPPLDAALLERLVIGGDLGALTPAQRLAYYRHRCEAIGLDPGARPFQYLALQGKLTLYADKGCAQQLAAKHGLSYIVTGAARLDGDIYHVRGRVTGPDGRMTEDVGVVHVGKLVGDALCNAIMKTHTKAYRRTVLAHCGLGMLDESEVETVAGAVRVQAEQAHALPTGDDAPSAWMDAQATASDNLTGAPVPTVGTPTTPDAAAAFAADLADPPAAPAAPRLVTDKQRKLLFARAGARVMAVGGEVHHLGDDLLLHLGGLASSADIPAARVDEALAFIAAWTPDTGSAG